MLEPLPEPNGRNAALGAPSLISTKFRRSQSRRWIETYILVAINNPARPVEPENNSTLVLIDRSRHLKVAYAVGKVVRY